MTDDRVARVVSFTATQHHAIIPDNLKPETQRLRSGLVVCVIGAGKGIGEHIAYAYACAGVHRIVIAARSQQDLDKVAQRIQAIDPRVFVDCCTCDVAEATSVAELADFIEASIGRLDVVVFNPGYAGPVTLKVHEGKPEWVQRAFNVNAMGTYHAAHYLVPLLLASPDGAKLFLAVGSLAALLRRGIIANTGYCISKMAQARFVEMIAEQYGEQGLVTLNIHPGAVATEMAAGNTPEAFLPSLIDNVALCGALCVWLSARIRDLGWLSGRLICANWDVNELLARKDEIIQGDLLKLTLAVM